MQNNITRVKTDSGGEVELYTHKIFEIADEYVSQLENPEEIKETTCFSGLIQTIYSRLFKPTVWNKEIYQANTYKNVRQNSILDHDNLALLDGLFDIYTVLCARYKQVPTLLEYGYMVGLSKETIHDWISGNTRNKSEEYRRTAKRWKSICEMSLEKRAVMSNSIGSIFTLKASYGWRETAPAGPEEIGMIQHDSAEQIASRHKYATLPDKPDIFD